MSLFTLRPAPIYMTVMDDGIVEECFDLPHRGYQDEKEDTTVKPEIEMAKPCRLCEHDNAKDNTCIYCNNEHRCWSRKR